MFKGHTKQRLTQIIIAIGLLAGSLFFLKLTIASIIATRPNMAITDLERTAAFDDIAVIQQHLNRLKIAIEWFPSNANFYTLAGRYYGLLAKLDNDQFDSAQTATYFSSAIELEPTVFQHKAWQVKYLYQQHGWTHELSNNLEMALKVGKYEKLSQTILLPIALANWKTLTSGSQQYIHQMLDNMFLNTNFFRQALRIAKKQCQAQLLAPHARNAKQSNQIRASIERQKGCF